MSADGHRKSCGEYVLRGADVAIVVGSAIRAIPLANIQRFASGVLTARGAGLAGRVPAVEYGERAPVPFALVFEHASELAPPGVGDAPVQPAFCGLPVGKVLAGVLRIGFRLAPAAHVPDRKVFEHDRLVFADQSRGQLVQEIGAPVFGVRLDSGYLESCLLVVAASFLLARQCPLGFGESFHVTVAVAWVVDLLAGAENGETVGSQVNADRGTLLAKPGDGIFHEDADMPASGRVEGHGDGAGLRLAWQGAGPTDVQRLAHLRQREIAPVPFERASRVFGGTAVRLSLVGRIVAGLIEEVRIGFLQVPQCLLQGHAGNLVEEVQVVGFLPY